MSGGIPGYTRESDREKIEDGLETIRRWLYDNRRNRDSYDDRRTAQEVAEQVADIIGDIDRQD